MPKLNKDFVLCDCAKGDGDTEQSTIEFDEAIGITAKSLLVKIDGEDEFVAFNEIHDIDEDYQTLEVSTWLCRKRGWV